MVKNNEVQNLHPSAEIAAEAGKLIGIDYPTKPAAPDDLERLIQEILHKPENLAGHTFYIIPD